MSDSNSSFVVERILNLLEDKTNPNGSDRAGDDDDDDADDDAAAAGASSSEATTESAAIDVRRLAVPLPVFACVRARVCV